MRTLGPRMNADDRNLLAELNVAIDDDGEDGWASKGSTPGPMTAATWGCCAAPPRPGELLTRGDVGHVHADRGRTVRRALFGVAPELVRLDELRPAVYRVTWPLSSAASGRLRRRPAV